MFNIDSAVDRKRGIRSYAANAYLRNPESALPQKNVIVLHGVCAAKVLFDSHNAGQKVRAIGVTCLAGVNWEAPESSLSPFELNVRKEIIVSAGELDRAPNAHVGDCSRRRLQHTPTPRTEWCW